MSNRPLATALCAAGFFLVPGTTCPGADAPRAAMSWEEMHVGLLSAQDRLTGVYVRYRVPYEGAPKKRRLPPGAYLRRVVAFKGPSHFFVENGHGSAAVDWRDDPAYSRSIATEDRVVTEWTGKRAYKLSSLPKGRPFPWMMQSDLFILATGWWPPGCLRPPLQKEKEYPYVLREIVADPACVLRPLQEFRGGCWCHVLERPGVEVLWLDASRGFALLERERWDTDNRAVRQRITLGDYREVVPGAWLPGWFEFTNYDSYAPARARRQEETLHTRVTVEEIRANAVGDDLFRFEPPPGAVLLNDFTGGFEQTKSGGLDYLESLAGRLRTGFAAPQPEHWRGLEWLPGFPALLVVGCWEIWRRRRAPRRACGVL